MNDLPRTLSIIVNDACPLRCKHCSLGYDSQYNGAKEAMTRDDLTELIKSAPREIFDIITFVGGEPSLEPKLIARGVEECRSLGMMSCMTTAPVWARKAETAAKFLAKFPPLDFLVLSFDRYHLEFLDIAHYEHATHEAHKIGTNVVLNICSSSEPEKVEMLNKVWHLLDQMLDVRFQTVLPMGNAGKRENLLPPQRPIESMEDILSLDRSCVVGNTIVDLDGGVHGCCWASAVPESTLSIPATGKADIAAALDRLEQHQAHKRLLAAGFIDSLGPDSGERLLEVVRGRSFVDECHLCLFIMEKANSEVWNACLAQEK